MRKKVTIYMQGP